MRLLTADQVSRMLQVPKYRVYELVRLGMIPHVRLGRQVRFMETALQEWAQSGGTPSTEGVK